MRPMLAVPTDTPGEPPAGPEWLHEVKWDGVRMLAETGSDKVLRLLNRNGGDASVTYPEVMLAAPMLPADLLLDGEVVVMDAGGVPSFQTLAHRMHVKDARRAAQLAAAMPATYMVFDVLHLGGVDVTAEPYERRRELLESLDLPGLTAGVAPGVWQVSPVHDDGALLADATRAAGLEGVVSKRRGSPYRQGARSADWVKTPHRTEVVAVIGGWIPEAESPNRLGALWVGYPADEPTFERTGEMYSLGRAGSGLSHADRDALLQVLRQTERATCPFDPRPTGPDAARSRWVDPMLCVQVRYLGRTDTGQMRQPVLRRLRPDVSPLDAATATIL